MGVGRGGGGWLVTMLGVGGDVVYQAGKDDNHKVLDKFEI